MKIKIKILTSIFILASLLVVSGCGLKQANPKKYILNLEIWGVFDNPDAFAEIIENYKKTNPNIREIRYKKLSENTYRQDLIDALAAGQGPDIFLIQNNWLAKFNDKVVPALPQLLTEQKFRANFADVAATDFINKGSIYAVPLSIDSLGLYYNKDIFNAAGISAPPVSWNEFMEYSRKITKLNATGQIIQSGAALGTSNNVNRATDILNLMFLQGNTGMVDMVNKKALFDQSVKKDGEWLNSGENALNFFIQFANRNSALYSWNAQMRNSIDAFSEGTVGMMLNYSWQWENIANKSPNLNFAVAPIPQLSENDPVNFPNYWAFAVAKNRTPDTTGMPPAQASMVTNEIRIGEAWQFLTYLTTKPEQAAVTTQTTNATTGIAINSSFDPAVKYLEKTNKPAARRDLIETQKTDVRKGAFAKGNLIAKNWYQADPEIINSIFIQTIDKVNKGQASVQEAVATAAASVTQLMR